MFHLKSISRGFVRAKLQRNQFLIARDQFLGVQAALQRFFDAPQDCKTLDPLEETRGVYLLEGTQ